MGQEERNRDSVESRFLETCDIPPEEQKVEPFILIIFGGTGDLSERNLLPTVFNLFKREKAVAGSYILGVGRREMTDRDYRGFVARALEKFGGDDSAKKAADSFLERVFYFRSDAESEGGYRELCRRIGEIGAASETGNLIYYLAVPPNLIQPVIEGLFSQNLCAGTGRPKIVVEKPFGNDRDSASRLNRFILQHFEERQVYRIDHYLGKETVQNILFFRFGNSIFEPLWNRRYIDHVQITVAEDIGIEGRGAFYDAAGVVRDIVQNHLMQLLALVAMEPPAGFAGDLVRDEKVKVFRAIRPMDRDYIERFVVRGQYAAGEVKGREVTAYRDEVNVPGDSSTPTFFAGKFHIDNWRWAGVPFYARAGKRLARRVTEICVEFKQPPLRLFGRTCDIIEPNSLVFSIQPKEEMSLELNVKQPGVGNQPFRIGMDFDYAGSFAVKTRPAYERLLLDCLKGDLTLFARADEVEAMWEVVDPIIRTWESEPAKDFPNYEAGSEGPTAAAELLGADERRWRTITA